MSASAAKNDDPNHPHIAFIIERSNNKNRVCYQGMLGADGALNPKEPVTVYWLDIDPAYVKKKRAKGIKTDREEINFMEKRAYGVSWGEVKDGKAVLQMQALPKRVVTLAVEDGKPVAYVEINGKQCVLKKIFVQVKFTFGIPSVQYIIISGVDPESGAEVEEKTKQ